MVETLAPVDRVEVLAAESFPPQYFLLIESGLPSSCAQFDRYEVQRAGYTVTVTIVNQELTGVACAEVYASVVHNVELGSDFEPGSTYSVLVNGVAETFVARGSGQPPLPITVALGRAFPLELGQTAAVGPQGPIVEFVQVVEDSRCPRGATCVWEGRARILIRVSSSGDVLGFGTQDLVLEPGQGDPDGASVQGTFDTYRLELLFLDPYPQATSAEEQQGQAAYVATLIVSVIQARPTRVGAPPPSATPMAAPTRVATSTPTLASPPAPACTKRVDWMTYTVLQGDTLYSIAQRCGSSVDELVAANCLHGVNISTGQRLYVPGPVAPKQTPSPQPIMIYLIIPEDDGRSGPPVGCGDSGVAVRRDRLATGSLERDIQASLEELFSIRTMNYGQSGYTHSLYSASLAVLGVAMDGDRALIRLGGTLPLIGLCADAQMEAQILLTIFQYPEISSAFVTLNGVNLRQVFDLSGTVGDDDQYSRSAIRF